MKEKAIRKTQSKTQIRMNALEQLKEARKEYKDVEWKSSGYAYTKLVDLDDEYLLNVMRTVSKSLDVLRNFPGVKEFQYYNNVKITDYKKWLKTEYLYRKEVKKEFYKNMSRREDEEIDRQYTYYRDKYILELDDIF